MGDLRSVARHREEVLGSVQVLPVQRCAVPDASGATLRETVSAALNIPPFDNSAMDGFAVRFADVARASEQGGVRLRVVADLPAGSPSDPPIGELEAVRIMTGAPVPTAADTIVPFEDTVDGLVDSLAHTVVLRAPREGAHVRRLGEDIRSGDRLLVSGTRLDALHIAALVAAGISTVEVSTRPRVAITSTGSELVALGSPHGRGQIVDSNGPMLAAMVAHTGADLQQVSRVDDSGGTLQAVVQRLVESPDPPHVIVFTGGVSAGAYEVVREQLASTMRFTKVAMQPGKPQGFGVLPNGTLLFGLPGNPVSAAVSFEAFVRPAILALQGCRRVHRQRIPLPAGTPWRSPAGREQYVPIAVDADDERGLTVHPATAGGSGSHLVGGLAAAVGFAVVPPEVESVAAGDLVDVMFLEGWL